MLERFFDFLDRLFSLPRWQLALLAVMAVALAAGGYLLLRPEPRPAPDFLAAEDATDSAQEEPREFTVHVSGAVAHPGVVLLAPGDRVIDAVEAAGGPLPEADLERLNLAQPVQDGQKVEVPLQGEQGEQATGGTGEVGRKINLNTADRRSLEGLPGIGPTLADRIIAYREKKGGFSSVDELKRVSGIGEKKFEEIRDLVEV
ncbi:MAG: helix-hairpin-helix domain-containing protein [Actinomycetota bacterium]|nr:helix-hairpin-helix domain-containing protein [Actinomycetota bacterium]MDD5667550.1 helix-hairpin-helix domain-containing protein [Actinomycetota bacterium]